MAIDATLYRDFWGELSAAERSLYKTDYIPRSLYDTWDRHIVEAAQQYDFDYEDGWRSIGEGARWAIRLTGLPPGSKLTPDADRGAVVDRKRPKHW